MGIQSFHDQIEECRRWAAELAGTPDQKLLEKIAREFSLLDAPHEPFAIGKMACAADSHIELAHPD
jgi:hypothetical protein